MQNSLIIHRSLETLGKEVELKDNGPYYLAYASRILSKADRQFLKSLGWKQKRHTRSGEEMWLLDKVQ